MLLEQISMPDFVDGLKKTRTVAIPCGAIEEHGSHLPLGTDTVHAYEVCREAASRRPLFVAPPLFYGVQVWSAAGPEGTPRRFLFLSASLLSVPQAFSRTQAGVKSKAVTSHRTP